MAEVAERLKLSSAKEALRYLDRHKVPTQFRGRLVVAHAEDVDGTLVPRKHCDGAR